MNAVENKQMHLEGVPRPVPVMVQLTESARSRLRNRIAKHRGWDGNNKLLSGILRGYRTSRINSVVDLVNRAGVSTSELEVHYWVKVESKPEGVDYLSEVVRRVREAQVANQSKEGEMAEEIKTATKSSNKRYALEHEMAEELGEKLSKAVRKAGRKWGDFLTEIKVDHHSARRVLRGENVLDPTAIYRLLAAADIPYQEVKVHYRGELIPLPDPDKVEVLARSGYVLGHTTLVEFGEKWAKFGSDAEVSRQSGESQSLIRSLRVQKPTRDLVGALRVLEALGLEDYQIKLVESVSEGEGVLPRKVSPRHIRDEFIGISIDVQPLASPPEPPEVKSTLPSVITMEKVMNNSAERVRREMKEFSDQKSLSPGEVVARIGKDLHWLEDEIAKRDRIIEHQRDELTALRERDKESDPLVNIVRSLDNKTREQVAAYLRYLAWENRG